MIVYLFIFLIPWLNVDSFKQPVTPDSSITFTILNAGFGITGTLSVVSTDINFKPGNLVGSTMSAIVDPSSIETGISVRDKHLKRSDYFDVARHPRIHLKSLNFKRTSRNGFVGNFDLTIKGIVKTIEIPFTVIKEKEGIIYETRFEIDRLDFNLGESSVILDNKVIIHARVIQGYTGR